MSKLFKLKEWLTLDEAITHISAVIGESVTIADLYQLAVNGELKLSVYFVNQTFAIKGKWLKDKDIEYQLPHINFDGAPSRFNPLKAPKPNEELISDDDWISWFGGVTPITGVWDLTMKGCEALDVEHYYQKRTSGISVKGVNVNGVLLQQDDVVCQLHEYIEMESNNEGANQQEDNKNLLRPVNQNIKDVFYSTRKKDELEIEYVPSSRLGDHDFVFVVKTNEITRFIKSLENSSQKTKPLTSNERISLLIVIAALCKEANVDVEQRGITTSLVAMTQLVGTPLSDDTIRKILKQIEPAVSSRSQ